VDEECKTRSRRGSRHDAVIASVRAWRLAVLATSFKPVACHPTVASRLEDSLDTGSWVKSEEKDIWMSKIIKCVSANRKEKMKGMQRGLVQSAEGVDDLRDRHMAVCR
jgi:hypothetical protein